MSCMFLLKSSNQNANRRRSVAALERMEVKMMGDMQIYSRKMTRIR